MILYSFNGVIYNGNCIFDFYKYCLRKNKAIIKYFFKQCYYILLYILGKKSEKEMQTNFLCFINDFENIDEVVEEFWKTNWFKIKKWYKDKEHQKDIIVTNIPEFLLKYVSKKLKVKTFIMFKDDYSKLNELSSYNFEETYISNYINDLVISNLGKIYIVKKNNIILYNNYNPSLLEKLKIVFLTPKFLCFIIVGSINALNGILFSYLYSLKLDSILAFVLGYFTSLIISYLLNSYLTFKDENISIIKFIKFCLSYIPNFLIQIICVFIIVSILEMNKLFAYFLSAIIGVPITYLFLLLFTFKKKK